MEDTESGSRDASKKDPTRSKVGRLLAEYDLEEFGDELIRLWTGEDGKRHSLRDLADVFNRRLLQTALQDAGNTPLDGEVENLYRLLTDDETSAGMRTQAETTLQRDGIDPDELRRDFVSHQAVHTYLTKYRDAEAPTDTTDPVEKAADVHKRLQSRLLAVTENNLQRASDAGELTLGEFSVSVDVAVFCEDCGTQRSVTDLLANRGCACERSADAET